jgi:hypothetical protein
VEQELRSNPQGEGRKIIRDALAAFASCSLSAKTKGFCGVIAAEMYLPSFMYATVLYNDGSEYTFEQEIEPEVSVKIKGSDIESG